MKTLFVTGASGFLGWNLCHLARDRYRVFGTYHSHAIAIPEVELFNVDLTDAKALTQLFRSIQPDAVIHTAAQSKPNFCQEYPRETYPINVTVSHDIADRCAESEIPCAFTSTDLVFDGLNPPYRETDPVNPVSYYGEQKVLAERGMLERYPKTIVCRMPLMFGIASPSANSFIQSFLTNLRSGKELSLFTDEFRTPVSATTAAIGLLLALETHETYLHLGGIERISRYEFGKLLADVLNLPSELIQPCHQSDVPMPAPRPPDVSMDSSKAFVLGYQPRSLREQLVALKGNV
jgi:dTDP-4-dehydrorhamnose reductase